MRASRTAAFYDKEILKYFVGTEAVKNVVIDASTVKTNADGRLIVEAGTVLQTIEKSSLVKPAAEKEVKKEEVVGILAHTIEFFGGETITKAEVEAAEAAKKAAEEALKAAEEAEDEAAETKASNELAEAEAAIVTSGSHYDEPGAAFFWNAIFDTTKLISYKENATAVQEALSSCRFE